MTDMPNKSQSLDPQSLVRAFENIVGKSTQDLEIIRLAGDASTRSYFRILKKNSGSTRVEMSWILQSAESFDLNSSDRHAFLSGQRVLQSVGVRVPRIVAQHGASGWILMEDLSDETLQAHPEADLYRQALDMMIEWTLKAHPKNPNLSEDVKKMPQFSWAFDREKLEFEMGFTEEHLFNKFLGIDGKEFRVAATPNSEFLAAQPRFYCHRDYHCRNLMFHEGKLWVIDFQDARMGPITYDLVSLLWDPYVRLSEKSRVEYLSYWKTQLTEKAKTTPWVDLSHLRSARDVAKTWSVELERMKIQRLLKAAGSYASFYNNKGRKDYLPATFGALEDTAKAIATILTEFPAASCESDKQLQVQVAALSRKFREKMETFS